MPQTHQTIASRLLAQRQELGLTRHGAAMVLGYGFDSYAKTEDGRRLPKQIEIAALARWLSCEEGELLALMLREREERRSDHAVESTTSVAP